MAKRRPVDAGAELVQALACVRRHHCALRVDNEVVVGSYRAMARGPLANAGQTGGLGRSTGDAGHGAHAAGVGVELQQLQRQAELVGGPLAQQEHEAEAAHAGAQDGDFGQVLLEHNVRGAGMAACVGEKPPKEPVGVDLVVQNPHGVVGQGQVQVACAHFEAQQRHLARVPGDRHGGWVDEGGQKREQGEKMAFCEGDACVKVRGVAAKNHTAQFLKEPDPKRAKDEGENHKRRSEHHHGPAVAGNHDRRRLSWVVTVL